MKALHEATGPMEPITKAFDDEGDEPNHFLRGMATH